MYFTGGVKEGVNNFKKFMNKRKIVTADVCKCGYYFETAVLVVPTF